MKIHSLNEGHPKNLCVPSEEMQNIGHCGKKVKEYQITTVASEVTCKTCLKLTNK